MHGAIFIDFEACSLAEDSWPIEIGLAWIDARGKIRSSSKLIKPHPGWQHSAWSERSEKVHGIPRLKLAAAEEASEVARWAADQVSNVCILSDAAEHDGKWLSSLMATIGREHDFEISSIQEFALSHFKGAAKGMFFRALANNRPKHRAADDAMNLAQAWRAALRKQEKL